MESSRSTEGGRVVGDGGRQITREERKRGRGRLLHEAATQRTLLVKQRESEQKEDESSQRRVTRNEVSDPLPAQQCMPAYAQPCSARPLPTAAAQ